MRAIEEFKKEMVEATKNSKDGKIYLFDAKERAAKIEELRAAGKELVGIFIETKEDEQYSKY
ncbi:MAG: hypothetical protein WC831_02515 [Parcubacteria group bacterium]|jgi:hypothetical protein